MSPPVPNPDQPSYEAENRALREENQALRASRTTMSEQATTTARHQQTQERFRTVFERSPLGHKIIGPDLAIRQANAAAVALLGLASPADLLGHCILDFVHPAHHDDWAALQAGLWGHQLPAFALETRLLRADGSDLWCRVSSVLFPDAGGQLGFTTLEDISPRKYLEANLAQYAQRQDAAYVELAQLNEELVVVNEELQAANVELSYSNAELDTFVYAASHDLRAPIVNLQGLLEALAEHLPAEIRDDETIGPIMGMMQMSIERFGSSLNRLADFGSTHQRTAVDREKLALAAVLENVRLDVAPLLAATAGKLEVDLAGNPYLWFSPKHLHSVLLNLVSNALKYRHPDRPPVVHVRSHRETSQLVVSVKDNGHGLTEAEQGQLFGLFHRFHPDVEGTGVGLYLVKKIMSHAGGSVRVESQPGRGTTFTLTFPT